MSYEDLQKEAKALGLKYVGVSKKNLVKAIEEAKETQTPEDVETPEEKTPESKVDKDVNVAIVSDVKGNEIRRYTVDIHGDNFSKLAKEFAIKHDYRVKLTKAKSSIKCPNCGHALDA